MHRLLQRIEAYAKERCGNSALALMVNNKLISSKGKQIYVKYERDKDKVVGTPLQFGIYENINGKNRFVPDTKYMDYAKELITDSKIVGIDVGFCEDDITLTIESNLDFKFLNVKQNTFEHIFEHIYKGDGTADIRIKGKELESKELTQSMKNSLYEVLDYHSMLAYQLVLKKVSKLFTRLRNQVSFYYLFDAHRLVFIKGTCIFNPMLEAHRYKRRIEESELYRRIINHVEEVRGIYLYFATDAQICEALNFTGYTKLNTTFLTNIIFGMFNDGYPNNRVKIYLEQGEGGRAISKEEYISLEPSVRGRYTEIDSLYVLCNRSRIVLGHNSGTSLYKIVETIALT